jgi:hypothetical protein
VPCLNQRHVARAGAGDVGEFGLALLERKRTAASGSLATACATASGVFSTPRALATMAPMAPPAGPASTVPNSGAALPTTPAMSFQSMSTS